MDEHLQDYLREEERKDLKIIYDNIHQNKFVRISMEDNLKPKEQQD